MTGSITGGDLVRGCWHLGASIWSEGSTSWLARSLTSSSTAHLRSHPAAVRTPIRLAGTHLCHPTHGWVGVPIGRETQCAQRRLRVVATATARCSLGAT